MKKISILLLAAFFLGITNINAQTNTITETANTEDAVTNTKKVSKECAFTKNDSGELICVKTGKICDSTCPKKASQTCCKGKEKKSCSKSVKADYSENEESSFDFNKSNNYAAEKTSCSKSTKKGCCKKLAKKQ